MNEHERYLFDLQGYLTVSRSLEASQLAELNAVLEEKIVGLNEPDMQTQRFGDLLDWGTPYRNPASFTVCEK